MSSSLTMVRPRGRCHIRCALVRLVSYAYLFTTDLGRTAERISTAEVERKTFKKPGRAPQLAANIGTAPDAKTLIFVLQQLVMMNKRFIS